MKEQEKKFFDEYINLQRKKADIRLKELKLKEKIEKYKKGKK